MAKAENRRCLECEQVLPLTDFRKNHKMAGGFTNRCKPCLLAIDHARWARMQPEERAAKKAQYRDQNEAFRLANPDRVRQQKADHYRRHTNENKARGDEWRRKNPERLKELARGWSNRRRSRCAWNYHIDHILPLGRGGKHEICNLCISCPPCNLRKNDKDPIEWAQMIGKLL